ncbi:DUF1214 domain-containing protein [Mycolicibacterium sp. 050232]|uniref:DUF1214 domain-containing protein n=1 Tax=Mycolicibacterium sp. 050232 TaxID=3113982 RepID=UPI002E27BC34|nr:DUF1214 domain-containing protein [Mycolicibacterium sp. 050232]MED5811057.1 DUF1214 domain-containing protein [Mycolicibacterium sp. 050232]
MNLSEPTQEPLGGRPNPDSRCSIDDFDYQIKYQRAFEALLWSLPSVQVQGGRNATFDYLGMRDCDILAMSGVATPKFETWTANSSTPYIVAYADLKGGPVVLEVPPAGPDGSLYGQVVNAWQASIADIGPSGIDGGDGAKVLFTAPDYDEAIPAGHLHVRSSSYRIVMALRSVPGARKTPADAYTYARRLRMYPLSQGHTPTEQRFVDAVDTWYPTLLPYDERYFELLHQTITYENARPTDRHMLGLLKSLGIERGKPYAPDEVAVGAMRQAAIDAWFHLQERLDNLPRRMYAWPDRQYVPLLLPDRNREFTFEYPDAIDVDGRALAFFWCTLVPAHLAKHPAVYYLVAMADSNGRQLEPGAQYRITIPREMPVEQFWSLSVYDRATMAFIYTESMRTTLDSYGLDRMVKNPDGSVTLYTGPTPPPGLESNWIPTGGKRPMPTLRFYGPTSSFYDGDFKMPDFERMAT